MLLIFSSCATNTIEGNNYISWKSSYDIVTSGEYLVFSWILIDKNDFWKPTNTIIVLNPDKAELQIPQAWSRIIDWKEYWYYNWEWAKIEAKKLWKRLPTSDEWKLLLSWSLDKFNDQCVWFYKWGLNIWSIVEKWGKSYWSSTDYLFYVDQNPKVRDYAMEVSLYDYKGKCDRRWAFSRDPKWQGFSVRGIPLD